MKYNRHILRNTIDENVFIVFHVEDDFDSVLIHIYKNGLIEPCEEIFFGSNESGRAVVLRYDNSTTRDIARSVWNYLFKKEINEWKYVMRSDDKGYLVSVSA